MGKKLEGVLINLFVESENFNIFYKSLLFPKYMKTRFIPANSKEKLNKNYFLESSKSLPKKIALVYSIQYEPIAKEVKFILEKTHEVVKFSQVLGCSKVSFPKQTQAVLLIGSGKFHAISLATSSSLPIYMYEQSKLTKLSEKEILSFNQRKKTAYIKFLSSDKIGVLVSTKPGQQNLIKALELKKRLKQKKLYFFLGDFLSAGEFENFGLNSWINTACPRLDMDSTSIINISNLEKLS